MKNLKLIMFYNIKIKFVVCSVIKSVNCILTDLINKEASLQPQGPINVKRMTK